MAKHDEVVFSHTRHPERKNAVTSAEILDECRKILSQHYGSRLRELVLYGSNARNRQTPESDIDLLVVLDNNFDFFEEQKRILDLVFELELLGGTLISALPVSAEDYHSGRISLYRIARREGVSIL